MKKLIILVILVVVNQKLHAQSYSDSSQSYNEKISTENNITTITLFEFDFNGQKVPLNITYDHSGIRVNEKPNSLGFGWNIQQIGTINRIVNDNLDNSAYGWFKTQQPTATTGADYYPCFGDECSPYTGPHVDRSPDFFLMRTATGELMDFTYKKNIINNIIGTPQPVILANADGYKINTNFSNFSLDCHNPNSISTQSIVFNIIDKFGNNYDFINGPLLANRLNLPGDDCRNNFFLKKLSNPSQTDDAITIEYKTELQDRYTYYSIGFNKSTSTNPKIEYPNNDYNVSYETRYDLKKITSKNCTVNFIYLAEDQTYLDEIEIKDFNGNYILGYKFEYYSNLLHAGKLVSKIKKYDKNKSQQQTLYECQYYIDEHPDSGQFWTRSDFVWDNASWGDYFGYFNNRDGQNRLPFETVSQPAKDLNPNASVGKFNLLHTLKNKYGGIIEFDYQMKDDIVEDFYFEKFYTGGLIISSKKIIPQTGKTKLITYSYDNLIGHGIVASDPFRNYCRQAGGAKFWSSIPSIASSDASFEHDEFSYLQNIHIAGSFYKNVTESIYDLENMQLLSYKTSNYIPNAEGVYLTPLLKKETFYQVTSPSVSTQIQEISYEYTQSNIESFNSYFNNREVRNAGTGTYYYRMTRLIPITVNRTSLNSKKVTDFTSQMVQDYNFTYLPNSKILRSKSILSAQGNTEDRYYYATDSQMTSEPYKNDFITANIVGLPLKTEMYKSAEKISEIKVQFAKDANSSNLLKLRSSFDKKGNDAVSTLKRNATYDLYDSAGNLMQFTEEGGMTTSILWGYNKSKKIAEIKNATLAQIASALGITQTVLKTYNESNMTAIASLRNLLPNSMVTNYSYEPLIGVKSITDEKEDSIQYNYDAFGRLLSTKDKQGNLIKDFQYTLQN